MPARPARLAGFFLSTVLLILVGLSGCSAPDATVTAIPVGQTPRGPVCRIGPDGGPPPSQPPVADRGIGGTGKPANEVALVQTADRGIGGTGIVGVVTGFASICVDGIEVAYDSSAVVDIDGAAADTTQLRVGDVVAIRGTGDPEATQARSISVRIEAAGRIDSLSMTTGGLRVGGQTVLVTAGIPGADQFTLGDWVSVSGLRRPDGVIIASRLDAARVDMLSVRGRVSFDGGAPHLGALMLPAGSAKPGDWVHVTGGYTAGTPHAVSVNADTLCPTPYLCFAGALDHILVQAYVRAEGGQMRMDGMLLPAQGSAARTGVDGAAIVSLERRPDGTYAAVDIRSANPAPKGTSSLLPPSPDPVSEAQPRPSRAAALASRTSGASASSSAGHGTGETASSIASLTTQPTDLDAGPASAATQANPPTVSAPVDISIPLPVITQQATTTLPAAPAQAQASGSGVSSGDTTPSGQQLSGSQTIDPNPPVSQPPQTPGSPLPVLGGGGVPISSNTPALSRAANFSGGLNSQTILSTGTAVIGGHPGIPIGSMTPSITTFSAPPPIVTVTPSLSATSSGAAAVSIRAARHPFTAPSAPKNSIRAGTR